MLCVEYTSTYTYRYILSSRVHIQNARVHPSAPVMSPEAVYSRRPPDGAHSQSCVFPIYLLALAAYRMPTVLQSIYHTGAISCGSCAVLCIPPVLAARRWSRYQELWGQLPHISNPAAKPKIPPLHIPPLHIPPLPPHFPLSSSTPPPPSLRHSYPHFLSMVVTFPSESILLSTALILFFKRPV